MRVLFLNRMDFLEATLPEGIALLSAILKSRGHEVRVFDTAFLKPRRREPQNNENISGGISFHKATPYALKDLTANDSEVDIAESFSRVIEDFKPYLIAVSAMTTNYEKSMDLLKKVEIPCKVVIGGTHSTLMPDKVIRRQEIDYACVGEGDEALLELCDAMEAGKDTKGIRNMYVKARGSGPDKIIENTLRPFVDLDSLPVPDLSVFDSRHFFRPFLGNIYKGIFMSTSRGCPRGCAYCVNNRLRDLFSGCGKNYLRFQSPQIVARNLRAMKEEYGITWFKFSDDTFLMRPLKDMYELRDLIKPLDIMFGCSVDPATVTEEKVRLAKEMGCAAMSIGIETGNERLRKLILSRHISNAQIKKAIRIVRDHGIKISTFNMIGLPGESREDVFETIRFNKELEIPDANVYTLYPFPGTKIYEDAGVSVDDYARIPAMQEAHTFGLSGIPGNELMFFLKAFNLYLVLPEEDWGRIEQAKNDPGLYRMLLDTAQDMVNKKVSYASA